MDDCHHRQLFVRRHANQYAVYNFLYTHCSYIISSGEIIILDPENMENDVLHAYIGEETEYI